MAVGEVPEKQMANAAVRSGWGLLWRRQRILWWVWLVNLALAWLASGPLNARWRAVLDHSLAADQLLHGFNLARYIELTSLPQIGFGSAFSSFPLAGGLFFLFMLFMTGGILQEYASGHKLASGEFFQASGAFFWRFVRLLLMMLIVLLPIAALAAAIRKWSGQLSSDSPRETLGFWVDVVGFACLFLLAICVRLWFDMAQVHAVVSGERSSFRAAGRALRLTWSSLGSLLVVYLAPSVVAWIASALILLLWTLVPGHLVAVTFLLGQLWMLVLLGTRLWQRGGEVGWYQSRFAAPAESVAAPAAELPLASPPLSNA